MTAFRRAIRPGRTKLSEMVVIPERAACRRAEGRDVLPRSTGEPDFLPAIGDGSLQGRPHHHGRGAGLRTRRLNRHLPRHRTGRRGGAIARPGQLAREGQGEKTDLQARQAEAPLPISMGREDQRQFVTKGR